MRNIMKKIVIAMCVAAASLGAVSCSNSFLEQTPETGLTSDTFYP